MTTTTQTSAAAGQQTQPDPPAGPTMPEQGSALLGLVAGYVGHRTVATGLRTGLVAALSDAPDGLTPGELADATSADPFYVAVWCRAAYAAGVCDRVGAGLTDAEYRLAPHVATLLLDTGSPAYSGGVFTTLEQPEVFERFEQTLPTGERMWWSDTAPEWIAAVAGTGRPFYTRLVPGGLGQVPGLAERLAAGCRILDTACGAGEGLVRLAEHYPTCTVVGADGDAHSIDRAGERVARAGLGDRVELVVTPLEELELDGSFTLVTNNISMHECRDADRVAANVKRVLEPGGWFVISDFPFPVDDDGLRTVPGRVMTGIQYFEAQIDDQLLPRSAYDDLLTRHDFTDLGSFQLTPMHAVTYGRA